MMRFKSQVMMHFPPKKNLNYFLRGNVHFWKMAFFDTSL